MTTRVNLMLDLKLSIQIEKEAAKRGITRAQYIKESIHEKMNRDNSNEVSNIELKLNTMKDEIKEIKFLTISILEKKCA